MQGCIEWQDTGSLLLAGSAEEEAQLRYRETLLQSHGVESTFLSREQVQRMEPSLAAGAHNGGLVAEGDAQIVSGKAVG